MELYEQILTEVKKAVFGKDELLEKILIAILAKGHILLEDIPGVGKTTIAKAFATVLGLESRRMQFTVDILPSDVVGFTVIDPQTRETRLHPGAVFCNIFLADEINRTSSRTQAALLEVMEENSITVDERPIRRMTRSSSSPHRTRLAPPGHSRCRTVSWSGF